MFNRKMILGTALILLLGVSAFGGGYWYANATLPTADGTWGQWWRDAYVWVSTALHLDSGTAGRLLYLNSGKNVTSTLIGVGSGNDLTGVDDMNATDVFTSNLYANTAELNITVYKNLKISYEGDSLTSNNAPQPKWNTQLGTYSPYIAKAGAINTGTVLNYASSGDTAANMVGEYAAQAHLNRPMSDTDEGWFFLFAGINDIYYNTTGTVTYGYLKTIWASARADGYKVVAFTVCGKNYPDASGQQLIQQQNLNSLIRSDPTLYDYLIQPDILLPDPTNLTYFTNPVHPTLLGQQLISQLVAETIEHKIKMGFPSTAYDPYSIHSIMDEETYSAIIWSDGNTYYAKDGHTGSLTSNKTDGISLINDVSTALGAAGGGTIKLRGTITGAVALAAVSNVNLIGPATVAVTASLASGVTVGAVTNVLWKDLIIKRTGTGSGTQYVGTISGGDRTVKFDGCSFRNELTASAAHRVLNIVAGSVWFNECTFTITGGAAGSHCLVISGTATPLITTSTGSGGPTGTGNHALYMYDTSAAVIMGSTFSGGSGGAGSYGAYLAGTCAAVITASTLNGGSSGATCYGAYVDTAGAAKIINSYIYSNTLCDAVYVTDTAEAANLWKISQSHIQTGDPATYKSVHTQSAYVGVPVYDCTVIGGFTNVSGLADENRGTTTLPTGALYVNVTHSLGYTPAAGDIQITLGVGGSYNCTSVGISYYGATYFTARAYDNAGANKWTSNAITINWNANKT